MTVSLHFTQRTLENKAQARSVKKPRAKLMSLTELFVVAEFRLF